MRLAALLPLLATTALVGGLAAADAKPKKGEPRTGAAGNADAQAAFASQAAKAPKPTGAKPVVVGAYVWGGRADEQYKPFFQWEFRLHAGSATLDGLKGRTITLNPDGSDAAVGAWKDLGPLANGATSDVSIRQNCPAFFSYRLELAWNDGGAATFACADKTTLPVAIDNVREMAYLVTTGYQHDAEESKADQKKRRAKGGGFEVSWWLWNLGGASATEVVQTVRFLDLNGKEVHRETVPLKDPVPGGARLEQKLALKAPPKGYQLLTVSADCAMPVVASGAGAAGFTGAKDLEIAGVSLANGKFSAKVRNGFDKDLVGLVITITLTDANGKKLEDVKLAVGDLASGAEHQAEASVTTTSFQGYEIGWDVGGG